jgi:hypothetical protein
MRLLGYWEGDIRIGAYSAFCCVFFCGYPLLEIEVRFSMLIESFIALYL